jgi:hypothetical protein
MKTIILTATLLLLSCYPQRERTVYYIFTFENQAGYQSQATVTKRLFDNRSVFDTTAGGINIRPTGYHKCVEVRIIESGDTYEY